MEDKYQTIKMRVTEEDLTGQELTAKEIFDELNSEEHGFSSSHEVATVLGKNKNQPELTVIEDSPYRYRFE